MATKAENKTKPTNVSVEDFIEQIENRRRRYDATINR